MPERGVFGAGPSGLRPGWPGVRLGQEGEQTAEGGTRTRTPLRALGPEPSVSAISPLRRGGDSTAHPAMMQAGEVQSAKCRVQRAAAS